MPSRRPRERGWPRRAPPRSQPAIRRRCQTRFAETHEAGPAGCATTPSGQRRIGSESRARSGLPPPAGCRGCDDHRDRNTGVRSSGHLQWRVVSSRGLQGILDNFPPEVRAMLDACAQSSCRRPMAGVNACRGLAVVVPGCCLRRRSRPGAANHAFSVKARCPVSSLQDLDGDPPHYSRPVSSGL
jgi:hypothetical protein